MSGRARQETPGSNFVAHRDLRKKRPQPRMKKKWSPYRTVETSNMLWTTIPSLLKLEAGLGGTLRTHKKNEEENSVQTSRKGKGIGRVFSWFRYPGPRGSRVSDPYRPTSADAVEFESFCRIGVGSAPGREVLPPRDGQRLADDVGRTPQHDRGRPGTGAARVLFEGHAPHVMHSVLHRPMPAGMSGQLRR